jgi:hypothetical protein
MAIAVAVAMVGGVSTITSLTTIQEAEAAKCSNLATGKECFCYNQASPIPGGINTACYRNMADCQKAQSSDPIAISGCEKRRT